MATFYEFLYPNTTFDPVDNTQVCCPFLHSSHGIEYYESNPSAGIKISENAFHCFSCGAGFKSEVSFASKYLNLSKANADKFIRMLRDSKQITSYEEIYVTNFVNNDIPKNIVYKMNISSNIIDQCKLGYLNGRLIIPIIMNNLVLDEVSYKPDSKPKYLRKPNTISGLIFPYDIWKPNKHKSGTIICAGEKDCLMARTVGLNAISFTGGENSTPPDFILREFKNLPVSIIYDNDSAGKTGAIKLALALTKYTSKILVVDISTVCADQGEDLWDFFNKYAKSKKDLLDIIATTEVFKPEEHVKEINNTIPLVSLHEAATPSYLGKKLRSNVQVVAVIDTVFSMPTEIIGKKIEYGDNDSMKKDEERFWELSEKNYSDMFYLIDSNLKENKIREYIKSGLLKIPIKESNVTIDKKGITTVHKCIVSDTVSLDSNHPISEFTAFSIEHKLENSKKYTITYKLVPHPQDGQKLVMVINDVEETDNLDDFILTTDVKQNLNLFKNNDIPFEENFNRIVESVKGILQKDYDNLLITVIDLWFHTPLLFKIGNETLRAFLDVLVIGDTRIGKSSTVEALQKTYELGRIISLAGNSATAAGIIGGSTKVNGAFQTRAGVIPQNNKGAIIFEELVKANTNLIRELTDIRSSNKVRISRVNGHIELPAMVRMLTLTNNKTIGNMPKPINSYPNGVKIITELIDTPEDIARYDLIPIFAFNGIKTIDPFFKPLPPFPNEAYKDRIRWIWTRKPEQIIISKETYIYTIQRCEELNKEFDSYIKLFGVEAWKKVLRIAIAIAGYVISTDETYENIIVKTEHINKAINIMLNCYDNKTFKFKEFVQEERRTRILNNSDIATLKTLYSNYAFALKYLDQTHCTTRSNFQTMSGLDNIEFMRLINELAKSNFIILNNFDVISTEKFKLAMDQIDTSTTTPPEVSLNV